MHQLVPAFILQNYAAGRTQGAFSAVGMFVDISGFTAMTDALMVYGEHGAEILARVTWVALEPLIAAVYAAGGFVATQAGDSFTALFLSDGYRKDPVAHREIAQCTMAAAWEIRQQAAQCPSYATPYGNFDVSVKVGAALGEAAWGILESHDRRRAAYYFHGTAMDGCVQAEQHARPGQVVVNRALVAQVRDLVQVESLGDHFLLTGLAEGLAIPTGAQAPLPNDLELAGRFFPTELFTQRYAGEFRQVAHLFVSLPTVGTEIQLHLFMQTVFDLQARYGGLLKLHFGDKGVHLLLLWGAPAARENDVQRALDFIIDLQARTEIPVNAGLTYRIAHAGFIGSALAEEYAAFGRGVNLAARFMARAPRGQVWLDERAAHRAQARYDFEFLGEKRFKGFAQPQKVYLLLERKEASDVLYGGTLVSREAELQALDEFVRPILAGCCAGALVVWSEPGMGKSRLVYEFLRALGDRLLATEREAPIVCMAQTDEILRLPFNPFRYWLRNYFGVSDNQVDARNKRSFQRKLDELIVATTDERLADELDRTRSFLGALLGLSWPDSLYEQLDAQGRYENTQIALTTLLQAESRRGPLIFVLEDAHWLDVDSKNFLPHLLRSLTAETGTFYPIAVLMTARFEGAGLPLDTFAYQQINLSRLSRSALAVLAHDQLGGPAGQRLLDLLEERTEGNPFFAEQFLHYLSEEGRLTKTTAGWEAPVALHALLPSSVNALLVTRLDRLPQEVREVVQTAAVLGREFDLYLLAGIVRDDVDLLDKVTRAEQESIWAPLEERRYIFKHALLRDAAYGMQVHARRQQLHALAAETLESLHANEDLRYYGEIAYHYEAAYEHGSGSARQPARQYLHKAAEHAARDYKNEAAVNLYSRALALTGPTEADDRWTLLLGREAVYHLIGQRQAQAADLEALETLAKARRHSGRQAEVALRRARHGQYISDYAGAEMAATVALHLAQADGDAVREVAARADWGRALIQLGDYMRAREHLKSALTVAQRSGQTALEGLLHRNLGIVAHHEGDYMTARAYTERALALARQTGDRVGECLALNNLGDGSYGWGSYVEAQTFADQALALAHHLGNRQVESYTLEVMGKCAELRGDPAAARRFLEQAIALARQIGNLRTEASALFHLGNVWLLLGEPASAQAAMQRALSFYSALGNQIWRMETLAGLSRIALARDDLTEAEAQARQILAYLDDGGNLEGADQPHRMLWTCYEVLRLAGDRRAVELLRRAHTNLQARAAQITDDFIRRTFLEAIPWNREVIAEFSRHSLDVRRVY